MTRMESIRRPPLILAYFRCAAGRACEDRRGRRPSYETCHPTAHA
jgi:hypothetical protein